MKHSPHTGAEYVARWFDGKRTRGFFVKQEKKKVWNNWTRRIELPSVCAGLFAIYNVRSVQFNPQWFLKNLYVIRQHNVYGTLFSAKLSSNLRYIHSYSQTLLTHFYSSRQQQRGYDVQKEYLKRKNVTDWVNFERCSVCNSANSPMVPHILHAQRLVARTLRKWNWSTSGNAGEWIRFCLNRIHGPKICDSVFFSSIISLNDCNLLIHSYRKIAMKKSCKFHWMKRMKCRILCIDGVAFPFYAC